MTPKRTHGPCTCADVVAGVPALGCHPDCPSLYPAQQEPDALTKLARVIRQCVGAPLELLLLHLAEQALALISEAREEQRKAQASAKSEALKQAAAKVTDAARCSCNPYAPCTCDWSGRIDGLTDDILRLKDVEP